MTSPDLVSLGWDASFAAAFATYTSDRRADLPGRVARVDRGAVDVFTGAGPLRATPSGDLLDAVARDPGSAACTGDWVALRRWPDHRVTVEGVLPRRTALIRAVASGRSEAHVLAANVDAVLVVVSLAVDPDLGRLERLLALAWESGAEPVVVLTKADLVADATVIAADVAAAAPGVTVCALSALTRVGLEALAPYVGTGRTAALVGQSGAGKSTLVNALAGATLLPTRDVRPDGKGRHTTTHRELVCLPAGGILLDTPGLRGVGLWQAGDGFERVFADVEAAAGRCRFADCAHETEPGCGVLAALEDGTLAPRRLESWRKLQREARWTAARTDARLRAEVRRAWKQRHLEVRRSGTIRP